jgi:LPS sulfotransferase NodH
MGNTPATRFVVTCPARTGSSMLTSLLQSHPEICCHGEVFGWRVFEGFKGINYNGPISEHRKPPIVDKLVQLRLDDPVLFLRDFVLFAGEYKAVGLKFKYEELSIEHFTAVRHWIRDNQDIKIIHLTRQNLLKRYASQVIATKITKVFNTWQEVPPPTRITLSPEECEREFAHTEQRQERYTKLFAKHDVLHMTYEELIADRDVKLTQIQTFLGLEPTELRTGMKKLNPDSLADLLENYNELHQHFVGTRFESFFD